MITFYFFNITEFQDLLYPLIELLKQNKKVTIFLFDCLEKKRQFKYYEKKELISYIEEILSINNCDIPPIFHFGQNEKKQYDHVYTSTKPSLILMQGIYHKNAKWIPEIDQDMSKVIHFAWGLDGPYNIERTPYKNITMNVVRRESQMYAYHKYNSKCFGNLRTSQLLHTPINKNINTLNSIKKQNKKICFIPERWIRSEKNKKNVIKVTNDIISYLKKKDYYVIFKKREKGWPYSESYNVINELTEKPDLVIDKDLYYPTSIIFFPLHVDICLFIGTTSVIWDLDEMGMQDKTIIYDYKKDNIEDVKKFIDTNAIKSNFKSDNKKITNIKNKKDLPSKKIINYLLKNIFVN